MQTALWDTICHKLGTLYIWKCIRQPLSKGCQRNERDSTMRRQLALTLQHSLVWRGAWSKTQNWAHLADDWLIWTTPRTHTSVTIMVVAADADSTPKKAPSSPWCNIAISIFYKNPDGELLTSWALPREVCCAPSLPAGKGRGVWPRRCLFQRVLPATGSFTVMLSSGLEHFHVACISQSIPFLSPLGPQLLPEFKLS